MVWVFAGGAFIVLIVGIGIWRVRRLGSDLTAKEREDLIVGNLGIAFSGLASFAVAASLLYSAKIVEQTQEGTRISQDTLNATIESQNADRFNNAVAQLASEKITERTGGVFALGGLLGDEHYRPVVLDLLSEYVRDNTKPPARMPRLSVPPCQPGRSVLSEPPGDIRAAVKVLVQRNTAVDPPNYRLDLSGAYLAGIRLAGANLANSILEGTDFTAADLTQANMEQASIESARFSFACMPTVRLSHAGIHNTRFDNAVVGGAEFHAANLACVDMRQANLAQAKFTAAANRPAAVLMGVDFTGAPTAEVDWRGVDLSQENILTQEQVRVAMTDGATRLPNLIRKQQLPPPCSQLAAK